MTTDLTPDAPDTPPPPKGVPPKPTRNERVWFVTPALGLHRIDASAAPAAIANDQGRFATPRDLAIAGVDATPQED